MRISIGIDFSRSSERALQEVRRRPWPPGTEFRLVTVVAPLDAAASQTFAPEFAETKAAAARERIDTMAAQLSDQPFAVSTAVLAGHPRSALNDDAARWNADLVVVGSRGAGLFRRLLLGSVAAAVVRGAPCSVEIVRPALRARKPGMRLLLATDGSGCSLDAARSVARRPWPAGSRLRVVGVAELARALADPWAIPSGERARLDRASRRQAREAVEAARRLLEPLALPVSVAVLAGDPRSRLVQECRSWKADLLVVGSHGRRGLDRLMLGSVSEAVAIHAPCSVEVVRAVHS
jgi:nucleotide-binding universal stress UspA family protein